MDSRPASRPNADHLIITQPHIFHVSQKTNCKHSQNMTTSDKWGQSVGEVFGLMTSTENEFKLSLVSVSSLQIAPQQNYKLFDV